MAASFSTLSSYSSSPSSLRAKRGRPRTLPHRRGQIKAAIFASFFASIARLLGAQAPEEAKNGANSLNGTESRTHVSELSMDLAGARLSADEGRVLGSGLSVESMGSSSASISSGLRTPSSPLDLPSWLQRPRSFHGGTPGTG